MSYQTVTEDSLFRAEQGIFCAEQGNLKSLFSLTYTALRSGRIGGFRRRRARRSLVLSAAGILLLLVKSKQSPNSLRRLDIVHSPAGIVGGDAAGILLLLVMSKQSANSLRRLDIAHSPAGIVGGIVGGDSERLRAVPLDCRGC